MNLMRNNRCNQNTRSISAASKLRAPICLKKNETEVERRFSSDIHQILIEDINRNRTLLKRSVGKEKIVNHERDVEKNWNVASIPRASSIEGVYLAFRVLRRLLLNTLSVTYSNGYTETSSKLSMLASMPGGQKKPGLERRISAATISLVGVKPKATWRSPRPSRVVSAKGDSTRIVSESSQYSDSSSLRILLLCERAGNLVLCDALIDDLPRAAKRRLMRSFRSGHLWDPARLRDLRGVLPISEFNHAGSERVLE